MDHRDNDVMRQLIIGFVFLSVMIVSEAAFSAASFVGGLGIYQIRGYSGGDFGNCAITVNKNINTDGSGALACGKTGVISFGCDGEGPNTKSEGLTLFNAAQLAYAMGRQVDVQVTDNYQYGSNVCVGTVIFVKAATFP